MSEKLLHEWTRDGWLFQISEDGRYVRSRKADPLAVPTGWCPWTTPLTADQAELARLASENERLRKCVEAADALRFNDVGLPSSAKDAYDAARKALEEK